MVRPAPRSFGKETLDPFLTFHRTRKEHGRDAVGQPVRSLFSETLKEGKVVQVREGLTA